MLLYSSFSVLQEIKWMVLHPSRNALDQLAGLRKGYSLPVWLIGAMFKNKFCVVTLYL